VDPGIQIVEDVPGDGTLVQRDEIVSLELQITLNRGEVVHPRQKTTVRIATVTCFRVSASRWKACAAVDIARRAYRRTSGMAPKGSSVRSRRMRCSSASSGY
jgi:hypothetical protein